MPIEGSITQGGRCDVISTALADVSTEIPLDHARDAACRDGGKSLLQGVRAD
jgi:hypothetical protein